MRTRDLVCICLSLCILCAFAYSETVFVEKDGVSIIESGGLYGWYLNKDLIRQPEFDYVSPFLHDYAIVQKDELYGIVSKNGKVVVHPKWYRIDFSNDFKNDGIVFLFGDEGNHIYKIPAGKCIYCGKPGDTFQGFDEGYSVIWQPSENTYSVIDSDGHILFSMETELLSPARYGVFRYENEDECGFVDIHGEEICKEKIAFCSEMSEGKALALFDNSTSCGVIDSAGHINLLSLPVSQALNYSERLLPVAVDQKWGYIDAEGKCVIPCDWQQAEPFSEGLAAVETSSGLWGYIDRSGVFQISPVFDNAFSFCEGKARVVMDGRWYYINQAGSTIGEDWDWADQYHNGIAIAVNGSDYFLLNSEGIAIYAFAGTISRSYIFRDLLVIDNADGQYYINEKGERIDIYKEMEEAP